MGFTYLLGPIMITLRPRLLTQNHLKELEQYSGHLWQDAVKLEELWRRGELDQVVQISEEELVRNNAEGGFVECPSAY